MTLSSWLREADSGSRRRGEAYAAQGRVRVSRRTADEVVAVVEGTESYDVQVTAADASCTCPIGQRGEVCKHVVATVLAAESERASRIRPRPLSSRAPTPTTPYAR